MQFGDICGLIDSQMHFVLHCDGTVWWVCHGGNENVYAFLLKTWCLNEKEVRPDAVKLKIGPLMYNGTEESQSYTYLFRSIQNIACDVPHVYTHPFRELKIKDLVKRFKGFSQCKGISQPTTNMTKPLKQLMPLDEGV